ncbi:MAG TPA: TonB-dependent receptor [bacterium]|nr:TonB-dependent receptor [bacterium]HPR87954.1 TonB-dependent receptor [bacterium]
MTLKKLPALLTVLILLITQAAAWAGQIQGKVVDGSTGTVLPGANIFLKGTAIGTISDLDGKYSITNAPEGSFVLTATYVGYDRFEKTISLSKAQKLNLNIQMHYAMVSMKEVTVTAQREGQMAAINQQIASDQIVNVVSQERIQELPDANAAEAVGRLPGVAVQRSGGEAQKVLIRGLDAKFATITLNGIEIPATNSENRDVDLSMMSQNALAGIEVYKALTPDKDADAIAGTVNLITGKAEPGQAFQIDAVGSYNDLKNSFKQYDFSGRYSNRFFGNKLGLRAMASASQRDRSSETFIDSWEIPPNLDYRIANLKVSYIEETRKRSGGEISFDYNTPDGGNIKQINVYSQTTRNTNDYGRTYPVGADVRYEATVRDMTIKTMNSSLLGENHLLGFDLDWSLAYAKTQSEMPFEHQMRFYEPTTMVSGMRTVGSRDTLRMPGKYLIPYAQNNFNKAGLDRDYFTQSANDDQNLVAKLDLEKSFHLSSSLAGFIKAGVKYRNKDRHRDADMWMGPYWLRTTQAYTLNDQGEKVLKDWTGTYWEDSPYTGLLTDFLSGPPYSSRMIHGEYRLYPLIDADRVRQWYNFNKNGISLDGMREEYNYLLESNRYKYSVEENVTSSYMMTKLSWRQFLTLIAGVRYEEENNSYTAKYAPEIVGQFEAQHGIITDSTATFRNGFWLPSAHLRIRPFKWWDIRFAVTSALARPDFQMRLPALYIDRQEGVIERRNPKLKTAISRNYDANMSFYSTRYGLLTLAGFYKEIDDMFYWLYDVRVTGNSHAKSIGLPMKYGPFNQYTLSEPVNTSDTKVWGYELEVQTHLGFLPGLLKNIIVNGNYSRIWSETIYPRFKLDITTTFPPKQTPVYYFTKRPLTGQTNYMGNLAVGYDIGGFSGRVSVYFQGPYLSYISQSERLDQYQKSFNRWDISLKQQITNHLAVFMNVNNLTNVIEGNYASFRHLDMGGSINGMTGDLGLRMTF